MFPLTSLSSRASCSFIFLLSVFPLAEISEERLAFRVGRFLRYPAISWPGTKFASLAVCEGKVHFDGRAYPITRTSQTRSPHTAQIAHSQNVRLTGQPYV